ncbi:hypothetical protein [Bacillus sp. Marseille-Q3570]|uniref:hypothetical protein n=1 Tax=Bacillus sp. Marseille-Q3570 TaxID=2963522 RepID=UPI0021B7ACAC|nr:hypothetical protein [Bacillus sp. Marseille-Q3570]
MGYVPPYVADQKLIYGSRTKSSYMTTKIQLQPVERIPFKNVTDKNQDFSNHYEEIKESHESFQKILSDLTGKGQNINEVI